MIVKACVLLLVGACLRAHGFYLPGVAPQDYGKGAAVVLKVNKLSSTKTQLPYEFYSLPYCRPANIKSSAENLGEVLRGDRIENSLYEIKMRTDEYCKFLCRMDSLTAAQAKAFQAKVDDQYRVNMILDNLPVAMVKTREDSANRQYTTYERGFPVGFKGAAEEGAEQPVYLNNHLRFAVLYHSDKDSAVSRVVGFEVEPFSVKHRYEGAWNEANPVLTSCNGAAMVSVSHDMEPQVVKESEEIIFTYDVIFKVVHASIAPAVEQTWSAIKWASRWDTYLMMQDDQIHWFSIVNSLMIVLFLSGMVAMIMLRTLHRDIVQYNQLESAEEVQEETGWKLVHGDVLRPPAQSSLLATLVGTGVQLLGMTLVTILFAMLGFLSPSNRGGLIIAMLLLFVLMGFAGGFVAGRLYRQLKGSDWRAMTLRTALLFPGLSFTVFFLLNLLIWGQASSGAVPFFTLTSLCFLWFGISVPLVCVGSLLGFRQPPLDDPVHTNKIPRQVTPQPWYMNPVFSCLLGSVLPFGAVFIELFFILTSIWLHQFYYIFGFLFLVAIILLITCAEISVVLTYFQLCSEDYRWWWRSFFSSGTSALYLLLYSAFYFCTKLDITATIPMLMYFSYMAVIAIGFFCLTGTIGFVASFLFIRTIYAAVKID